MSKLFRNGVLVQLGFIKTLIYIHDSKILDIITIYLGIMVTSCLGFVKPWVNAVPTYLVHD